MNRFEQGKPSLVRTGLKAGMAFAGSVIQGAALSLLLGGGAFVYYIGRLQGPGYTGARAGGVGAVLAVLASPPVLVAVLLAAFCVVYLLLGVARGRGRAMQQVVRAHGETFSRSLAQAVASRIEAMPRTHGVLNRSVDGLSADALCQYLAPVLGQSSALRGVLAFVLSRLPMSDVLADWQQARAERGDVPVVAGGQDPVLRALLERRIGAALHELAAPSYVPLCIALVAHAAVFGLGLWLTR